jgi:thymidylate synthase
MHINTVSHIRQAFLDKYQSESYVTDKTGVKTIEIVNASFVATESAIFGAPNQEYIQREINWYNSMSLSVRDLDPTPKIWEMISSNSNMIHSNYGNLIYSHANGLQYENVKHELKTNPNSRRAVMIYTRPTMHSEFNTDGMSDFICTNAVQYMIRDNKLEAVVQMRSNDVVFGYRNDYAWQLHVLKKLASELDIATGDIHWNVGSLHVYERHFKFIQEEVDAQNKKVNLTRVIDSAMSNCNKAILDLYN